MADERLISQLLTRWEESHEQGKTLSAEELCVECPNLVPVVRRQIEALRAFASSLKTQATEIPGKPVAEPSEDAGFPPVAGYEILGVLGRGGMGVVYKARHLQLNRLVALKTILAGRHAHAEDVARFRVEAEAVARLQHPNIVQIHEIGEQDGLPYFSLEFVDGGSLDKKLAGVPQPARAAAALMETLARAVHYAHVRGVVHRDLKPGNMLVMADGTVKITDFGLAKRIDTPAGQTQTGAILGTPSYMAPEQAEGRIREIGPAADIYALGAILYELLTGQPPFRAESAWDTIAQVIGREPVAPRWLQPNLPADLETICLKCLRKEPGKRYASAADLADDLHRFLNGESILARPIGVWERTLKWARRKPALAGLIAVGCLTVVTLLALAWWHNQRLQEADAVALVRSLETADTADVPRIIAELGPYHFWADPLLQRMVRDPAPDRRTQQKRLHARLALLPVDSSQVPELQPYLLQASAEELEVLTGALSAQRHQVIPSMWHVLENPQADRDQRFRAACVLARFDPDDERWLTVRQDVATHLVQENPLLLGKWARVLEPIKGKLLAPLTAVFRDPSRPDAERFLAADLLAAYGEEDADRLAGLIQEATPSQFNIFWPKLAPHRERILVALQDVLSQSAPVGVAEQAKDRLAWRQANAAVAILRLGRPDAVWDRLRYRPDPRLRTFLIHAFQPLGVEPLVLADRFRHEPDDHARQALLLGLGSYPADKIPLDQRRALTTAFLTAYRTEPDPGVHSALDWLLRQRWDEAANVDQIDAELRGRPAGNRRWFVNRQGQTFAVLPGPVEFDMGSTIEQEPKRLPDETFHRRRIDRSFALATKEVTLKEFLRFKPNHKPQAYGLDPAGPVIGVSWYEAAQYCRWLSKQEGIPEEEMCYPPIEEIAKGMVPRSGYLKKKGYRLPTEAEWEYACRAKTTTSRYYGQTQELLNQYAWNIMNAEDETRPVGQRKPNGFGLFDMFGNAAEWCQEQQSAYPNPEPGRPTEDREDREPVLEGEERPARGGAFYDQASMMRAARRYSYPPQNIRDAVGIRIAKTYP